MEFLVTMTTHVPRGTTDLTVAEVRSREAARSRELPVDRSLLRLWKPPQRRDEWRTLGLFAAADAGELHHVLASMPLDVWRSNHVVPLAPHPNDSRHLGPKRPHEFLTMFTITPGIDMQAFDAAQASESEHPRTLAEHGYLVRLWMLAPRRGRGRALGLWTAASATQMKAILATLPLTPWMTTETIPLSQHPNDPAIAKVGAIS
jgi:muconolactone delta-isomerase